MYCINSSSLLSSNLNESCYFSKIYFHRKEIYYRLPLIAYVDFPSLDLMHLKCVNCIIAMVVSTFLDSIITLDVSIVLLNCYITISIQYRITTSIYIVGRINWHCISNVVVWCRCTDVKVTIVGLVSRASDCRSRGHSFDPQWRLIFSLSKKFLTSYRVSAGKKHSARLRLVEFQREL